MTSKFREYLKTVQELQVQGKVAEFTIDMTSNYLFNVIIQYRYSDGMGEERKRAYFDFYDGMDDEKCKDYIRQIKKIIREQY